MFKNQSKSKKGPWVPPPGRSRKTDKIVKKAVHIDEEEVTLIATELSRVQETLNDSKLSKNDMLDTMSLASHASINENNEGLMICVSSFKQEYRVLNVYFMSLRPVSQFLIRYFTNINSHDPIVQRLLAKIEEHLNSLVTAFEDLEYSVSLFENTMLTNINFEELMKIIQLKENLLRKLLGCYTDILTVFQVALEEQLVNSSIKKEKEKNSLEKQLQAYETKNFSQNSNIKDLERRLTILQEKYSAVQSYNTTLEETKAELQKRLHCKDIEIKNLSAPTNQTYFKQNDERLIGLIERLKNKAQAEKTALKKALKVQKLHIEEKDKQLRKCENDLKEKMKMLFDLAAQRDKLKVQMTVTNNEVIQNRYQVEEIKSQKLKLQNDLVECEQTFRNKLQEATHSLKDQLSENVEANSTLQKKIQALEDELNSTKKEMELLKASHIEMPTPSLNDKNITSNEKVSEHVKNLITLLEDSKEKFKVIRSSTNYIGDGTHMDSNSNSGNILTIVQDIKRQMEELKRPFVSNGSGDNNKGNLERQLEEYEHLYKKLSEENASLKSKLLEVQHKNEDHIRPLENMSNANMPSDFSAKNLQMELMLKNEEIWRIKKRETKLLDQLEEVKDKLQKKEMESCRIFSLEECLKKKEEDLKGKEMEISVLEKKKQEESERLLHRNKELQGALDDMTANYDSLQRYVDMLKSSLYNVFGSS